MKRSKVLGENFRSKWISMTEFVTIFILIPLLIFLLILHFDFWILNCEFWTLNFELWIFNIKFWTLNFELWTLNFKFYLRIYTIRFVQSRQVEINLSKLFLFQKQ